MIINFNDIKTPMKKLILMLSLSVVTGLAFAEQRAYLYVKCNNFSDIIVPHVIPFAQTDAIITWLTDISENRCDRGMEKSPVAISVEEAEAIAGSDPFGFFMVEYL